MKFYTALIMVVFFTLTPFLHSANTQSKPLDLIPNSIIDDDFNMSSQSIKEDEILSNTEDGESKDEVKAKIVHVSIDEDLQSLEKRSLYIGELINIRYKIMLFDDAKVINAEFTPSINTKNLDLVKVGEYKKNADNTLSITYSFKIKSSSFTIPSLTIRVQSPLTQDSASTDSISLKAISLSSKKDFSNVIANSFDLVDSTFQSYDDNYNMMLLEIQTFYANLEDFHIQGIKDQEFTQSSTLDNIGSSYGFFIARVPKSIENITFSYFNSSKAEFETINLKNIISSQEINNTDLQPINSTLRLIDYMLIILMILVIITLIFKRSVIQVLLLVIIGSILGYRIFNTDFTITTKPNARLTILPSNNSTILLSIKDSTKLKAIKEVGDYYKVLINSKVGWINKNDTK